ncbi:hypothetical protein KHQ81_11080 [Mycoplasmatota bacterium]|nr:hypothetical protein KHQ81_11080 [Mycoplasmatota bacterium]
MNNINVFASSTISGGNYDNIRIFGSAEINGDVVVTNMDVYGSTVFNGTSEIINLKVFGSCHFKSYTCVKEMDIKGSCTFKSDVKVDILKVYGSVDFKENISRAKEVSIYGDVDTKILEADKISIKGYINCTEQLNGETIEVSTNSGSKIKEIVGSDIHIRPDKKSFSRKIKSIHVDIIEGDNIYLEYVTANIVRGNNIKIGPHCKITSIEYKDSLEASDKSQVEKSNQL